MWSQCSALLIVVVLGACSDASRVVDTTPPIDVRPEIEVLGGRAMALVRGTTYEMGCDYEEYAARRDLGCDDLGSASPVLSVTVPTFRIMVNEVTQREFAEYLSAAARPEPASCQEWDPTTNAERPYQCADWSDADAFCRWAGSRLCSEAEWELAARGPASWRHPWGNDAPTCERANLFGCTGQPGHTLPVGTHPLGASPYGVQDMLGNVAEWVEDDYHASHVGAPTDGSAWVDAPRAAVSVVKGGNFTSTERTADASERAELAHLEPDATMNFGPGIRCCRSGE